MPKYTLTLPERAATRLQAVTARYNSDNGTQFSVTEWLELHLKEIAIGEDLASEWEALQAKNQELGDQFLRAQASIERLLPPRMTGDLALRGT